MCEKVGLKAREPLKLGIMIAKESGKKEEKDTCPPKEYFIIITICPIHPVRESFRSVRGYPNLAITQAQDENGLFFSQIGVYTRFIPMAMNLEGLATCQERIK
jgi:hypothetical protein